MRSRIEARGAGALRTKLTAPNSSAVVTLPRLLASPTTTTCASGKLAFVTLKASAKLLLSNVNQDQHLLAGV